MTMTMRQRQPSDLPAWLQRILFGTLPTPERPEQPTPPDPFTALRAEFQAALTTERATFQAALATEQRERESLAAQLEREREHGRQQGRTVLLLEKTIEGLQRTLEEGTRAGMDREAAFAVLRDRVERLDADLKLANAANAELQKQLALLPPMRTQQQQMIMEVRIWRDYSYHLRELLGTAAPALPDIPLIKLEDL